MANTVNVQETTVGFFLKSSFVKLSLLLCLNKNHNKNLHLHLPGQYFAWYPEMKDEFETVQRDLVCKEVHTPSLDCDEENLSGKSWWSLTSFESLLQWHLGPVPDKERKSP